MVKHWGGNWTELKLLCLQTYIEMFAAALKDKFSLWYIDALAGTGAMDNLRSEIETVSLFDNSNSGRTQYLVGSSRIALENVHPFNKYVFIEKKRKNCLKLRELCLSYEKLNTQVIEGDANEEVRKICSKKLAWDVRGVLLFDPFGLEVDFETLRSVSNTDKFDVWYLFPTDAINRCLPRNGNIDPAWEIALARVLGV